MLCWGRNVTRHGDKGEDLWSHTLTIMVCSSTHKNIIKWVKNQTTAALYNILLIPRSGKGIYSSGLYWYYPMLNNYLFPYKHFNLLSKSCYQIVSLFRWNNLNTLFSIILFVHGQVHKEGNSGNIYVI